MRTVNFGSDNGGLSYGPYKQVVAIKSMDNYSNNKLHDPHGFKEQVKIMYKANKAIAGKFPNGTAALMELLSNDIVPYQKSINLCENKEPMHWISQCFI